MCGCVCVCACVGGGWVAKGWFAQSLSDLLGRPVVRPVVQETTALGAAYLAGMQVGFFGGQEDVAAQWQQEARFDAEMDEVSRESRYGRWKDAVGRVLTV